MAKDWMKLSEEHIFNTYARLPVVAVKGKGAWLWDDKGKKYLDFIGGRGTANLGHCHPSVVKAVRAQVGKLIHVTNDFYIPDQVRVAELLCGKSFAQKVFFANSGAEANEAAIKLARKYSKDTFGPDRHWIITMRQSFHGRTMATITATAQEKFHHGFEPMLPGFKYVPFNDLAAVEQAADKSTCAIMVEPIQGEGGVNVPSEGYLQGLRKLADREKLLLIFDEVQVGMSRVGRLFAYEHFGVTPDILTLAKSIAGGVAFGAMLSTREIGKSFSAGTHATTFGGNPLASAASLAALTELSKPGFLANVRKMGEYLRKELEKLASETGHVREIRGAGLIIGVELDVPGADVVKKCMDKGLLLNCTMGNILRFLPPLIITKEQVNLAVRIIRESFKEAGL